MQALMALRRYLHIASIKSDELEFHNFACDIVSWRENETKNSTKKVKVISY